MRTVRIIGAVRMLSFVCVPVALGFLPALAFAHSIVEWEATGPVCTPLATVECRDDGTCFSAGGSCRMFEGDTQMCAPIDAAYCTTDGDSQCPVDRPHRVRILDVTFCMSDAYRSCPSGSRACFGSAVLGDRVVDWDLGDCDRDGQANALDPAPCLRAPFIATVGADGSCNPTQRLCRDDIDCRDAMQCRRVSTTNPHEYCLPPGELSFCCGGLLSAECPNAHACSPTVVDGFDLCHPYCDASAYEERLKCLAFGGTFPVPAEHGDCDGDGLRNQAELERGGDPCTGDDAGVVSVDAGANVDASVIEVDASVIDIDASVIGIDAGQHSDADGPRLDAGAGGANEAGTIKMDGAMSDEPTFAGGGGVLCGVGVRRSSLPSSLALLALCLLGAFARRRSRSHVRTIKDTQ